MGIVFYFVNKKLVLVDFGFVGNTIVLRGCSLIELKSECKSETRSGVTGTGCSCSTDKCNAGSSILPYSSFVLANLVVVALAKAAESYCH